MIMFTPATESDLEDHCEQILQTNFDDDGQDYEPLDNDGYKRLVVCWIREFVSEQAAECAARSSKWNLNQGEQQW